MKAFIVSLTICALALIAGASAANSAPTKAQHFLVGYDHAPTAADRAAVANAGGDVRHAFSSINALAVSLPSGKQSTLQSQTGVSFVEPDAVRTPQAALSSTLPVSQLAPSLTNGLYGLLTAHVMDAAANTGGAHVTTCVADTGLDTRHPDIAPNLKNTYDVFANHGAGAEGLHATDVNDLGVALTETHATHVAGIIAGADDGQGIRGVAPHVDLLHARVLATQADGSVSGETSEVMQGVAWLAAHGCKVINMSLGGGDRSQAEERLYNQVTQDGTLIVVASGNDSANQVSFPGRYQNVLTVGAVDVNNQLASFSNTGAQLDLVAPGVDNLSSFPKDQGRDAYVTVGSKTYPGNPAEFAPATAGVSGPFVNCGLGLDPADCTGKPASGTWVALIKRGSAAFAVKAHNARLAGASAVVLYNNTTVPVSPTLGTATDGAAAWLPTIIISQADGTAIAASTNPTGTAYNVAMAWNLDSGTSMATPHVAGVAALVFGKNPKLNPHEVEMILEKSATDLGVPNYDTTYGYGVVNAKAALAATP